MKRPARTLRRLITITIVVAAGSFVTLPAGAKQAAAVQFEDAHTFATMALMPLNYLSREPDRAIALALLALSLPALVVLLRRRR